MAIRDRLTAKNTRFLQLYLDTVNPAAPVTEVNKSRLVDDFLHDFTDFSIHVRTISDERRPTNSKVSIKIPYAADYIINISTYLDPNRKALDRVYNTYGAGPYIIYYKLDNIADKNSSSTFIARCIIDEFTITANDFYKQHVSLHLQEAPLRYIL